MAVVLLAASLVLLRVCGALLYPRESPYREVKELNGLWNFRADYSLYGQDGFLHQWYLQPLSKTGDTLLMPVPSSYNDITQNATLRDLVGVVWYDRQVWVPRSWFDGETTIRLRFESAHYYTTVWVNGIIAVSHEGGHLPFEADVTNFLKADTSNTITVAVNNTLTPNTVPPGTVNIDDSGHVTQHVQMDFFNYAGIQRPVKLYTVSSVVHVDDITLVTTLLNNGDAQLYYSLEISSECDVKNSSFTYHVQLMGKNGEVVAADNHFHTSRCEGGKLCSFSSDGYLVVDTPNLWWPWTMSSDPGYLYTFQVNATAECNSKKAWDLYHQPVGLRTVAVDGTKFLINGKQFYFHGFGKHEDADIRGKGLDYALLMKDMNLLLWLGANAIRTSHYPYAEELMDLCDKYGIVVIDELPAVGLNTKENFANATLEQHLRALHELFARDKNRPGVVMWSLANEPKSNLPEAEPYFKNISLTARSLDPTRPLTFACNMPYDSDLVTQFMDVIAINRYFGWYASPGYTGDVVSLLTTEVEHWYTTHQKPIMLTEYGAAAIAGIHKYPPVMYSEEYQGEVYSANFPGFDELRKTIFVGEMLWNFADFETAQVDDRPDGNKKGVLTRERQPKMGAFVIRTRYHQLASEAATNGYGYDVMRDCPHYCYSQSNMCRRGSFSRFIFC